MQAGCLAAGAEKDLLRLGEWAEDAKAALVTERAALSVDRKRAKEALQELEIARTIATDKEQELERAHRAKLTALENAATVRAELEATRAELEEAAASRANAAKADEEFDAGFFQGYGDLKRRVTVDHPEWDLSAYSRADSDFWEVESPIEEEAPAGEEGAGDGSKAAEEAEVEIVDPPA